MIAVCDTGPLLYLSLIDCASLLPRIFDKVLIPRAVAEELSDPSSPAQAAALIEYRPLWLQIRDAPRIAAMVNRFGRGELEAIALAQLVGADVLLTDDRSAKNYAIQVCKIAASGSIGVLYQAAVDDSISFEASDFDECVDRLLATNFRRAPTLLEAIKRLSRSLHERKGHPPSPQRIFPPFG